MPKKIKYLRPKEQITEARYCDLCSAQPVLRTRDFSYFVCSDCATQFDSKSLIVIPDNHISQLCAQKPIQTKPIRSRKRDYVRFERNLQTCRDYASLVSSAEREYAEIASAKLSAANKRLLKKYFPQP